MSWPLSQDFNEAVQNPATAFGDPDLKGGAVGTNAMGVPIPRSGNYADVYQITAANGQKWAVKCFTRPTSADLDSRYAAVSEHLHNANLPFTVGFNYLQQGIRVRGQWYPIVKMQWVDGFPINAFVRDNLNRSTILENMLSLWVRLCRRLRETGMAHCDIQHGNVLLVPAEGRGNSLGLKLVDYDGMFVPALASQPSGEAGHPSFQHPERVTTGAYSADLDRFPHLVVATALRGLLVGGKALWDKFDTGDNLLFTEKDFKNPGQSKVFKELWETGDPFTVGLVGHLALACMKSLHQTPWLDQLMPGGQPPILTPSQERQAAAIIGGQPITPEPTPSSPQMSLPPAYGPYPPQGYAPPQYASPPPQAYAPPPVAPRPVPPGPKAMAFDSEEGDGSIAFDGGRRRRSQSTGSMLMPAIVAGGVLLACIVGGVIFFAGGKKKSSDVVQKPDETRPDPAPPVDPPKLDPPKIDPTPPMPPKVDPPKVDPVPMNTGAKTVGKVVWSVPVGDKRNLRARTVVFSLDGSRVIVAQQNTGQIDVHDATTGKIVATCREHEPPATAFPFPLPGGKVMSAAREPVMIAWDGSTGRPIARAPLAKPKVGLTAVRADQKGQYVVLCWDDSASVIDIENGGRELVEIKYPKGHPSHPGIAIAADGSAVLSITPDGRLRETRLPGGAISDKPLQLENAASITAWSPAKKLAAIRLHVNGALPGNTPIVNTETGEVAYSLRGGYALPAGFSADGRFLVAFDKGQLEQWDTGTWKKTATVPLPGNTPSEMSVSADGQLAVLTGTDQKITLVSFSGDATPSAIPAAPTESTFDRLAEVASIAAVDVNLDAIRQWAVDRTGKTIYFATDAAVYPVDVATKKQLGRYAPPEGTIRQLWATGAGELVLEVRAPARKTELHVLDGQLARLTGPGIIRPELIEVPKSIHVAAGGSMAAITKDNGQIACIDLKTGRTLYTFLPKLPAISAFFTGDAAKMIANCGQRLEVYPFAERPAFRWFDPKSKFNIDAIVLEDVSPDGKAVAFRVPGADNTGTRFTVGVFDGWKPLGSVSSAMTGNAVRFRFVGDGSRAVASEGNQVTLFDTNTGRKIAGATTTFDAPARAVPGPTGEFVLLGTATGATLYRTTAGGAPTAAPPAPMAMANKRLTVPDAAALAAAEKTVKETFAADYAKKLPADRKKLGERLFADAKGTANAPPAMFFMLREAMALAVETQDAATLMKAADALDETFDVDGFAFKVSGLEKIAQTATQTTVLRATADSVQELAEELIDKDEYEKAIKLAGVAASCLGRAGAAAAIKELESRMAQVNKLRDGFELVKASVEKLKTTPEDAEAHTAVGRFRCFLQGRWDEGFKHLEKCSDAALKALAELELKAGADSETNDAQRGDRWWEYAEKVAEPDKAAARGRAKYWYAKALLSVPAGLERTNAEKRLTFTLGGTEYRPGLVLEIFQPIGVRKIRGQLVATIEFQADNTDLVPMVGPNKFGARWTGVVVPPSPGRYKLIAETRDEVRVTLGSKPDEKRIISNVDKGLGNKDAFYVFGEKPVAIVAEYGGQSRRDRGLTLKWVRPGSKSEEVIPVSAFFHKRDDDKLVTDK
jgi:DNA-binding beta-propeller fold protein YncE